MAVNFYNGYIVDTPVSASDPVRVSVPNLTMADRVTYGPLPWRAIVSANGDVLWPSRGDRAIIADDASSLGDQWIVSWYGTSVIVVTEKVVNKGVANGYTPLDANSKVPIANLPLQVKKAYSDGGADVCNVNDDTLRKVLRSDGNYLGKGMNYIVPTGETHIVKVEGVVMCSADSFNWTSLGARMAITSDAGATWTWANRYARGFFNGYNAANLPNWSDLEPTEVFTLTAGTWDAFIGVQNFASPNGNYGGAYARVTGWNSVFMYRIG